MGRGVGENGVGMNLFRKCQKGWVGCKENQNLTSGNGKTKTKEEIVLNESKNMHVQCNVPVLHWTVLKLWSSLPKKALEEPLWSMLKTEIFSCLDIKRMSLVQEISAEV